MSNPTDGLRIVPAEFYDGWVLEIDGDIQSHVDLNDPTLIRFEYLRRIGNVLDICWSAAEPLQVLHLGAGALTLVRYVQATRPGSRQLVVERDTRLMDFVTSELPLPDGTHLTSISGDARAELDHVPTQTFDAIVVDIFTGYDTEVHLTEAAFYQELLQRLSPHGILLANIGDDDGLTFLGRQAQLLHTLATDDGLNGVWILGHAPSLAHQRAGNAVLAAGPGLPQATEPSTVLQARLAAAGPHPAAVLSPHETTRFVENLAI